MILKGSDLMYFDEGTYQNLYSIAQELGMEAQFAGYFSHEGDYYICTNMNGYEAWLSSLFDGAPDDEWLAWSGTITGKSTQGSGTN